MILSSFTKLSDPNFVVQVQQIVEAMTGNAAFPEPWPATVPTLAQIQADFAAYQNAFTATASGDRGRIVERENARTKLAADLSQLALHVQMTAQGNTTLLATSGFPLRQRAPQSQPEAPPAPARIKLSRGEGSGTLVVSTSRVPTAGSNDVQVTTGAPTDEATW